MENPRFKMTKWAQGVHAAIHDNHFWMWVFCSNKICGPLTHFMLWVQQNSNNWPVYKLVCGKLDNFLSEYDSLLAGFDTWFSEGARFSKCVEFEHDAQLRTRVMDVLLLHATGFKRRIADPLSRCGGIVCFNFD